MFEEIDGFWNYYDPARSANVICEGISYCDKTYRIERNHSEMMSFEYIIKGEGTLKINGQTLHPRENDVYILTKHSNHVYYSDAENPWTKIWLQFDGSLLENLLVQHIPEGLFLVENCDISAQMYEIRNLCQIYKSDYDRLTDEVTVVLLRIMIHLKNHLNRKVELLPERIKQRLDCSLEESMSLDEICQELNYTKNHVIKVFKDYYGLTPYAYYRDKKIQVAKRYLDNTNLSIGEIASRLHFADSRYFAGCFKQVAGITPSAYRRRK